MGLGQPACRPIPCAGLSARCRSASATATVATTTCTVQCTIGSNLSRSSFAAAEVQQWVPTPAGQILPLRSLLHPFLQEHARCHQAWSSDQTASPAKSVRPSVIGSPPLARQAIRRRREGTRATRALAALRRTLSPLPPRQLPRWLCPHPQRWTARGARFIAHRTSSH
jgi:hypothetical protein